ncbi:hypothetical protein QQS45_11505 [Alteriqipengyuania flavescens]|uniref:hypothetical protein n=1 Tax=Alteriqipengyuania flavescens TaxID=3053610 RepID=UPI0025B61E94|nr:hypothetical protein [Alteriqipengyuania flavescens]WJY18240.1 hypothetical protein QQW98_11500 [Alteriqipengyuania flavescens]WJY24181.1 hypothetical protein QQS45_11505 [Alteriqipengyuania flavescens]
MTDKTNEDSKTIKEHRALMNQGSTTPSRYPKEKTEQYRELTTLPEDREEKSDD